MSNQLVGEIDIYPWLIVNVETNVGAKKVRFIVDTGFNGELAIPRSETSNFGLSDGSFEAVFANGNIESASIVECRVEWIDGYRDVIAMYIDGPNPLLGMELLDDCLVTLEIENGRGDIMIEPNI